MTAVRRPVLIGLLASLLAAGCVDNGAASDKDRQVAALRWHLGGWYMAVTRRQTSCGVIVTDGQRILLGHATRSPRWDIPKGIAEPGENFADAAAASCARRPGLVAPPNELAALGVHPYLRGKDLALFAWAPQQLPDPKSLACSSHFASSRRDIAAGIRPLRALPVGRGAGPGRQESGAVLTSIPRETLCGASG